MQAKLPLGPKAAAFASAAAALCLAGNPGEARAQAVMAAITPLALQIASEAYCDAPAAFSAPGANAAYALSSTKSEAILGGAPSQLDRIRMQQSGITAPLANQVPAKAEVKILGENAVRPLQPAAGGLSARLPLCGNTSARSTATASFTQTAAPFRGIAGLGMTGRSPDDFLASKRIPISRTSLDGDWSRVRLQHVSAGQLRKFGGGQQMDRLSLIGTVNSTVNHKIRYVEDRQLFGKADYWAGARTTLRLGKGDCEDIALAKMQLLAAAGIARKDMILTIARDLARNADHAVLIVRHEGRYLLLDNSTDKVLDASYSYDYRPIFSFGESATWLHGY